MDALEKSGLVRGNKVQHQVSIPEWIHSHSAFQKACVRGLMDTDGGVFFHHHTSNGHRYRSFGLTFCNHSLLIVHGMARILREQHFKFSIQEQIKIYMYKLSEVQRYFQVIGTHNPKNVKKLRLHLKLPTRIS